MSLCGKPARWVTAPQEAVTHLGLAQRRVGS